MKWNERLFISLILVVALAFIPVMGMAVAPDIAPTSEVYINGNLVDLSNNLRHETEGSGSNQIETYTLVSNYVTDEYTITSFNVAYKADPYIVYGISIMDMGAPTTFSFVFSTPINPTIDNCNTVSSTMSFSTTDGGTDGVTVTPVEPASLLYDGDGIPEIQVTMLSDGINNKNTGNDLGAFFQTVKQSDISGPFSASLTNKISNMNDWNSMAIYVDFMASGGGDIVTMNGRSDITQDTCAPEFPTLFFPAVALIGMLCAVMILRIRK